MWHSCYLAWDPLVAGGRRWSSLCLLRLGTLRLKLAQGIRCWFLVMLQRDLLRVARVLLAMLLLLAGPAHRSLGGVATQVGAGQNLRAELLTVAMLRLRRFRAARRKQTLAEGARLLLRHLLACAHLLLVSRSRRGNQRGG